MLFRIDPVPYQAQVNAIEAQLKLSTTRLAQMTQLFERDSGRGFDVEQRQSEVDQLKAQLESAKWNLDKTVVRAPADGYVTNVALRKGARVANLPLSPVMAFIDTSDTLHRCRNHPERCALHRAGQPVEITFKFEPGMVRTGKVESDPAGDRDRQAQASGTAVTPKEIQSAPFVVRVRLDDAAWRGDCRPAAPARPRSTPRRQADPHHPQGAAAADRDPELRQSVLRRVSEEGRRSTTVKRT